MPPIGADGATAIGGIGGLLQGYVNQRNLNQQSALKQQELQNAQNETALKAAPEGLSLDPTTGKLGYRSDFYTPGTDAYETNKQIATNKRESNYRFGGGIPAELAVALQRGQPIPDQYKNYEIPGYELSGLKPGAAVMNPANQAATPEQIAAFEKVNGAGTAGNLTAGAFNRNANAQLVGGMAGGRQQNQIKAEADRQAADLAQKKALQEGQHGAGQRAADTAFGKQYNDYTSGDRGAMVDTVAQLKDASAKMRAYQPSIPIPGASYISQMLPGTDLSEARNQAEAATSSDLKAKFGSRVSNLDLMTGLKFTYNPKLTPQQNADHIDQAVIAPLQQRLAARDAKSDFYENNNNSLYGYKAPREAIPSAPAAPPASGPPMRGSLYQKPGTPQNDQVDPAARAAADAKLNIPPGIQAAINDPSQIAEKAFSPSRNKTRITLKNGKSVVLSGDLR